MSLIADIAVFQCDNCQAMYVCKDKESWELFEETWSECFRHYCPACRVLPEVAARIVKEKADFQAAILEFESDAAEAKFEYAH